MRERLQWKSFFSVAELDEATEKKIVTESAVFFRLLAKVLAKKTRPKNYSTLISTTYFPFSFSKFTSVELAG